jgi:alanyl-tRNA synthetase
VGLGNVVELLHAPSGARYFDVGFGVERVASAFAGGDLARVGPVAAGSDVLRTAGFAPALAQRAAGHLLAAERLIREGVAPGNRGVAYLLRKLLRRAAKALDSGDGTSGACALRAAAGLLGPVYCAAPAARTHYLAVVAEECRCYSAMLRANRAEALRVMVRHPDWTVEDLRARLTGTLGLPLPLADRLIAQGRSRRASAKL